MSCFWYSSFRTNQRSCLFCIVGSGISTAGNPKLALSLCSGIDPSRYTSTLQSVSLGQGPLCSALELLGITMCPGGYRARKHSTTEIHSATESHFATVNRELCRRKNTLQCLAEFGPSIKGKRMQASAFPTELAGVRLKNYIFLLEM